MCIVTKYPPEKYYKMKVKAIGEKIEPLIEYKNNVIVFEDYFGSPNSERIDQFFVRGTHDNLDVYPLSHFYFDLPKRTIRNRSNIESVQSNFQGYGKDL